MCAYVIAYEHSRSSIFYIFKKSKVCSTEGCQKKKKYQ